MFSVFFYLFFLFKGLIGLVGGLTFQLIHKDNELNVCFRNLKNLKLFEYIEWECLVPNPRGRYLLMGIEGHSKILELSFVSVFGTFLKDLTFNKLKIELLLFLPAYDYSAFDLPLKKENYILDKISDNNPLNSGSHLSCSSVSGKSFFTIKLENEAAVFQVSVVNYIDKRNLNVFQLIFCTNSITCLFYKNFLN